MMMSRMKNIKSLPWIKWEAILKKISQYPTMSHNLLSLATYASLITAAVLIGIKLFAYILSDSLSLFSTLIDSTLDGAASFINFFAVRRSLQPATAQYRFGHGKVEALAALGQSAFIAGSSMFLFFSAIHRFYSPQIVEKPTVGVIVMGISIFLTIGLVSFQRYVISRTKSLAISADSLHYFGDILINASVILALILGDWLKWYFIDPLFAIGIGFYILRTSWLISKKALSQLMDHELSEEDRKEIKLTVLSHPKVIGLHDLRTRSSGLRSFIQLHLELEDFIPLIEAHTISDEVESKILTKFPHAEVLIHQDPRSAVGSKSSSENKIFW